MCWGDKGKRRAQEKKYKNEQKQPKIWRKKIKNLSLWTAQIITAQTHQGMISCSDVHISSQQLEKCSIWRKRSFWPLKSIGNVIKKAGISILPCIQAHTILLLPVQLLHVGKLKKQIHVLDVDQTSLLHAKPGTPSLLKFGRSDISMHTAGKIYLQGSRPLL